MKIYFNKYTLKTKEYNSSGFINISFSLGYYNEVIYQNQTNKNNLRGIFYIFVFEETCLHISTILRSVTNGGGIHSLY